MPTQDTLLALLRLYGQTLALSLLFVGTGAFLHRTFLARRPAADEPLSLEWARAFFLGLSTFLLLFVFVSRGTGSARVGLWLCMALMGGVCSWQIFRRWAGESQPAPSPPTPLPRSGGEGSTRVASWRRAASLLTALLLLIGFFSVTNATLWITWNPTQPAGPPGFEQHFGSIHSGRYANYALFIAEHDRIPFVPQNLGQSMLCGVHLLLGPDCPLAALMAWVPFSLAFLTLLLFGFFRAQRFPFLLCLIAAFLVLYCNVAVSLVHVLVFDNGSPLAFVGYTDAIVGVATFLIMAMTLRDVWAAEDGRAGWPVLFLAGLLGVTWCWYAPQNVVLAAFACAGTTLVHWWPRRREGLRPLRRWSAAAAVFVAGVILGGSQLGAFLPRSLREDVGSRVFAVRPLIRIRPYTQHAISHWTGYRPNVVNHLSRDQIPRPRPYENTSREARPIGRDELYRRVVWFAEDNLWTTLRTIGFPVCGFALFWWSLRRERSPEVGCSDVGQRTWLWLTGFTFLGGFAISYGLELDGIKWWLARFLVPGSVMAIACLALVVLRQLQRGWRGGRAALWVALVVVATWGPVAELAALFQRNFLATAHTDPIGHRLDVLVQAKGPYR